MTTDSTRTLRDTEKAEAAGWGAEEGKQELAAETLGEADAKAAQTPKGDGAETPRERAPRREREVEDDEDDNTQTYDEYLAAQAAARLSLATLPTARQANEGADESQWKDAVAIARKGEQEQEWFLGTQKTKADRKSVV